MPPLPPVRTTADALPGGAALVALPLRPGNGDAPAVPGAGADELGVDVRALVARHEASGKAGDATVVPLEDGPRLVLLGTGDGSPQALRRAGAALARRLGGAETVVTTATEGATDEAARAFVEGLLLAAYRFTLKSDPKPVVVPDVALRDPADRSDALRRARAAAESAVLARDLANTPSLEKTPAWLAKQAQALPRALRTSDLTVTVLEPTELAARGFGGILAVGMGSTRPPRLIEVRYAPAGATRHVVLVGKGITFDTGGLSLKPNDGMVAMKTDMGGGAAVLGAVRGAAALGLPVRVTALVAAAENMPSGSAQRPGDVIRHFGGRTVEVLNTDAEGRLVLADALAYADAELDPDVVVDVATLTGAMPVALGRRHAGLFATDDALAAQLEAASAATGERVWRMPLVEDYRRALDSPVADLKNIGDATVQGGSITAALFLREFTGGRPWAHLDIAGPGRSESDEHEVTKGATGYGARLLLRWLEDLAATPARRPAGARTARSGKAPALGAPATRTVPARRRARA